MSIIEAVIAIFQGGRLCFFSPDIRRLALWPWTIGSFCSLICLIGALFLHQPLLQWLIPVPHGFWLSLLYGLAWIGTWLLLFVCTVIISLAGVMVFAGVFQSSIATEVLKKAGFALPDGEQNLRATIKDTTRSLACETIKLLWLIPLGAIILVIGFFPILVPLAIILSAWLLAYQFLDIVLEVLRVSLGKRMRFAVRHWLRMVAFGIGLLLICCIPFAALFLPPIAVAGAAWWLGETAWGKEQLVLLKEEVTK